MPPALSLGAGVSAAVKWQRRSLVPNSADGGWGGRRLVVTETQVSYEVISNAVSLYGEIYFVALVHYYHHGTSSTALLDTEQNVFSANL